jgi:multidrug efflux pump subunit AcrB
MVLASQFESLKHPLTIMVSLPLALVGALLALLVTGHHLSLGAMIGVILLMGLVTKNAILLVDGALQNLRSGLTVNEALLKAGPRRLRPILMTSAAMAIAMMPTALGTGLGSEFRAPMAIVVIGGVISSTFLTLLVVPVVFAALERVLPTRRTPRIVEDTGAVHPVSVKEVA